MRNTKLSTRNEQTVLQGQRAVMGAVIYDVQVQQLLSLYQFDRNDVYTTTLCGKQFYMKQ